MSILDPLIRARQQLHDTMADNAIYIDTSQTTTQCTVRQHYNMVKQAKGSYPMSGDATMNDVASFLVFLVDQVPMPQRKALVIFSPSVGYAIGPAEYADRITVKAGVSRLSPNEIASAYGSLSDDDKVFLDG